MKKKMNKQRNEQLNLSINEFCRVTLIHKPLIRRHTRRLFDATNDKTADNYAISQCHSTL